MGYEGLGLHHQHHMTDEAALHSYVAGVNASNSNMNNMQEQRQDENRMSMTADFHGAPMGQDGSRFSFSDYMHDFEALSPRMVNSSLTRA